MKMKNWLKQQVTEVTAWIGLYLIIIAFLNEPYWLNIVAGIALIFIDDTKASAFVKKHAPWLQSKIDEAGRE
jgi:hypothetical protein